MKASRYNIYFTYDQQRIGFNSRTGQYIILDELLFEMVDACTKHNDFQELQEVHSTFYEFLYQKGFLIEEEVDEVELVKQAAYAKDHDDSFFELHINPTMNCNFKCWYCYETHIKDSKMDETTIVNTLRFIKRVINEQQGLKKFSISWFGGEPLLYFKKVVTPILRDAYNIAKEKGIEFVSSMTTNGLLINQEMIDVSKQYGFNFFQITLDGSRERHNKVRFITEERGSYDQIISNIILAAKSQLTVNVRINVSKETLEGIREIASDFYYVDDETKSFLRFDFHKVWQVGEDLDHEIEDVRTYFRKRGYNVASGTYDTVENSCYGDHRNHATINYNGEVFKCTARDFTHDNSEGLLKDNGTIEWNPKYEKRMNIKFKNKPCLECRIMPICAGGCTQQAIEHEGVDYCIYDFDENKKLKLIINRFTETLHDQHQIAGSKQKFVTSID